MFLKILLAFSIAFSPVLQATQFAYQEIDRLDKVRETIYGTPSLKIQENNRKDAIDLFFCDIDGVLSKDHARNKGDVIPINNNSQDLFNTIRQNKGKVTSNFKCIIFMRSFPRI